MCWNVSPDNYLIHTLGLVVMVVVVWVVVVVVVLVLLVVFN